MLRYKINNYNELAVAGDGDWIEYTDHLAAIAEKDKEIERLKETTIDVWIKVPKEDSDGTVPLKRLAVERWNRRVK